MPQVTAVYHTNARTASRVRTLARRASPTNRALLSNLAKDIAAEPDSVKIIFTRGARAGRALDLETGADLLLALAR